LVTTNSLPNGKVMVNLTIRIPKNNLVEYIDQLYDMIERGSPQIGNYIRCRLVENDQFLEDCYAANCYILNFAAFMGKASTIRDLLEVQELHEYLETKDENGKTPMEVAIAKKYSTIALLLMGQGAKMSMESVRTIVSGSFW